MKSINKDEPQITQHDGWVNKKECRHHENNIIHYLGSGLPNGTVIQCRNCGVGWDKDGRKIEKCLHKNAKLVRIIDDDHDDREYKCKDCLKTFISEGIDS